MAEKSEDLRGFGRIWEKSRVFSQKTRENCDILRLFTEKCGLFGNFFKNLLHFISLSATIALETIKGDVISSPLHVIISSQRSVYVE